MNRITLPDTRITAEWRYILPRDAMELLGKHGENRHLDRKHVHRLARDMRSQDWQPGTSILLDEDESLFDGQHRLEAIVESGQGQWMLVVTGLERTKVQPVMDRGRTRTFGQMLQIEGVTNANNAAAAYRALWFYSEFGRLDGRGLESPTLPELAKIRQEHPDIKTRTSFPGLAAGAYAAFLYLAALELPADAEDFHAKLMSGRVGQGPGEGTILVLRERITNELRTHTPIGTDIRMIFLVRTWNAWQAGEDLAKLQFKAGGRRPDRVPLIAGCPLLPRLRSEGKGEIVRAA